MDVELWCKVVNLSEYKRASAKVTQMGLIARDARMVVGSRRLLEPGAARAAPQVLHDYLRRAPPAPSTRKWCAFYT